VDSVTTTAIKSFQAYEDLLYVGWIGAKTETVLIERSGIVPPGEATSTPEEIVTSVMVRKRVPPMWASQGATTCWAGAFAMMYAWKWTKKPIVDVLDEVGGGYRKKYIDSAFLYDEEMEDLAGRLNLTAESEVPKEMNWAGKISDHGPLMLAQKVASTWLHWIVVVGYRKTFVFPDGPHREDLKYNNPGNGTERFQEMETVAKAARDTTCQYRWYHF
jgi:hypothetical protein